MKIGIAKQKTIVCFFIFYNTKVTLHFSFDRISENVFFSCNPDILMIHITFFTSVLITFLFFLCKQTSFKLFQVNRVKPTTDICPSQISTDQRTPLNNLRPKTVSDKEFATSAFNSVQEERLSLLFKELARNTISKELFNT